MIAFLITRDFAGVRDGRASSPRHTCGEATREAVQAVRALCKPGQHVRVWACDGHDDSADRKLVACYMRTTDDYLDVEVP